jgi:hypothetical protein
MARILRLKLYKSASKDLELDLLFTKIEKPKLLSSLFYWFDPNGEPEGIQYYIKKFFEDPIGNLGALMILAVIMVSPIGLILLIIIGLVIAYRRWR